jgi:hypothetical protein
MNGRFRKVAVFVGAAALAGGVGVGVAAQGGGDAASSPAAMSRQAGGPGGPRAVDVGALAQELGVTEARLEAALRAARPSRGPADGGSPPGSGDDPLAAALAEQLGLSTDKVSAALEAVRPAGGPGGAPPDGSTPPATDGSTADATAA